MRTLLSLSVAVLAGLLMTRVAKPLKLPSVTAYLVAGVLIGPYCLGLLGIEGLGFPTQEAVDSLSLISEVCLLYTSQGESLAMDAYPLFLRKSLSRKEGYF